MSGLSPSDRITVAPTVAHASLWIACDGMERGKGRGNEKKDEEK